ncbi:hypothetical protein [Calidithermus chliarophilus]|uniref:hypothetical protein n=1 Tax=Calidithermus chliarophilus TaxID=52023 RepID=UPI000401E64A|nr:hypothetical protein [Calidithermus chliarophilus]
MKGIFDEIFGLTQALEVHRSRQERVAIVSTVADVLEDLELLTQGNPSQRKMLRDVMRRTRLFPGVSLLEESPEEISRRLRALVLHLAKLALLDLRNTP